MAIHCGGRRHTGFTGPPWFGFGRGETYGAARNYLTRQYLLRPGTRFLTMCPFGDLSGGDSFSISPYFAEDVNDWVRAAHVDALEEAKKRTGCKRGLHIGFWGESPTKYQATRAITAADKPWVQQSIKWWDWAGINGEFAFDASSSETYSALAEEVASWIAPTAEIMLEGIPFSAYPTTIDAAKLVKHPAWAREDNQWVINLPNTKLTAPLTHGGKQCREAVVIFLAGTADSEMEAKMELLRKRNFSIGCCERYDALLQKVMAAYPAA